MDWFFNWYNSLSGLQQMFACAAIPATVIMVMLFTFSVSAETESDYTYTVTDGKATITDVNYSTDYQADLTNSKIKNI